MNERISRVVAGIEAVVFMLPLTGVMLFLVPFAGMIAIGRQYPARDSVMLLLLVVLIGAIVCGWKLMYAFLRHGAVGLRSQGTWLWIAPCIGVAVLLVAALLARVAVVEPDQALAAFALFGNGSMAVIPLAHLLLERILRANKTMEPTR